MPRPICLGTASHRFMMIALLLVFIVMVSPVLSLIPVEEGMSNAWEYIAVTPEGRSNALVTFLKDGRMWLAGGESYSNHAYGYEQSWFLNTGKKE